MTKVASQGLARAQEIYRNRDQRVKELKAEGKKVFGYLCIYPVLEMMTALDIVPYRMLGDVREPITTADAYMRTTVCPFLRNLTDLTLKGRHDFLDGMVFAHTCEAGAGMCTLWRNITETPYTHFIDTPATIYEESVELHKGVLGDFQKDLEEFTGKKLTSRKLKTAIIAHNRQRALVRELYDLRKPDPPLISGVETLQVLKAVMSLPLEEGSELLGEVISEVKERQDGPTKKSGRLLLWGPVIDDTVFIEMIESLDANIVMDDTCVGSRPFFPDVEPTDDPLDGLAYRYLVELRCARTYRDSIEGAFRKKHMADVEARFSYLKDYAKEWKVNGVILPVMRYCDCHGYEVPGLRDYLDHLGLPSIYLEYDYSQAALAPLRTRVQGFLEVIG